MSADNVYITFLRRWYWLIAIGILVGAGATYLALHDAQPLYRSTSTVQVGRTLESANPDQADLAIADRLMPYYAELAQREPILDATIEQLQLPLQPDDIRARLRVSIVPGTQLIDIHVVDENPELAAALANEISRQLVLQSPSPIQEDADQGFIKAQLVDLKDKISRSQDEIESLEDQIPSMASAADVFEAQERLEVLQAQVDTWQTTYASLLDQVEPTSSNVVTVISQALPANAPIPQRTMLYYALAVVIGMGLSGLLALGLNEFSRKIRDAYDLRSFSKGTPVVTIPRYKIPRDGAPIVLDQPLASATRSYRVLRNMIETQVRNNAEHVSLAVTSSNLGEGKTTTAANLGVALANSNHQVVLVDANVRNPQLEELFGLTPALGFSDLISGEAELEAVVMRTSHPNLRIIGGGSMFESFHDLLASARVESIVNALRDQAAFVLFDTPAVNEERETQLLAKYLDGVLIVAESQRVTGEGLQETLNVLNLAGATVPAFVLNKYRVPLWRAIAARFSPERRMLKRSQDRRQRRIENAAEASPSSD